MKRKAKKLTPAQERAIDIQVDWSCALCWTEKAQYRIPKKDRDRVLGGSDNPRLSEMAELAHQTKGQLVIMVVPIGVDYWAVKRAMGKIQDRTIKHPEKFKAWKPPKRKWS